MTPAIASRFQWIEAFSRRLFAVADVAALPVAWAQLLEDPAGRLESQLLLMAAEPDTLEAEADESRFVPNPISQAASFSRRADTAKTSGRPPAAPPHVRLPEATTDEQ